ncbi:hypothetical protein BC30090_p72 (plasmid) [Bacillus cereus]|uniref:rolling circle replication-associated protein n=3 Tax=Bacillaceae TaxID=186817 RepID=UPI0008FDAC07|nr:MULTISPECIES: hypothetical protein [Bacillus]OJD71907.1 hypothetical protein BAU29_27545 [Bacillus sp. P14-1]BCD26956.1 hypothetical protein BC30090_p72 [Bacillus cereus]HDR7282790.1 hypothetical protein [Bacillus paranthracis]
MDYKEQHRYKKKLQRYQEMMIEQETAYEKTKESYPNYVEPYDEKLVISGFHIIHSQYEKPIWRGFKRNDEAVEQGAKNRKISMTIRKELDNELQNYVDRFPSATKHDKQAMKELKRIKDAYKDVLQIREDNEKRKIRTLKNKIQANFDEWTHFLTLTFKENLIDITRAKEKLKEWVKKMKVLYPDFLYVYVMEFQERVAIHFHVLCRMDKGKVVPKKKFMQTRKTWDKLGNIDIKGIRYKYLPKKHVNEAKTELQELSASERMVTIWSVGNYLTSYLEKGADDVLLFGSKMYGASSGLKEEIVLRDKKRIAAILLELGVERLKEKTYEIQQTETDNTITMKCYNQLILKN